jgi:hypothetical protein
MDDYTKHSKKSGIYQFQLLITKLICIFGHVITFLFNWWTCPNLDDQFCATFHCFHWSFWALVHGIKKPLCKTSLGEDPRYVHKYVYMSIVEPIVGYVLKVTPNIFVKHLTICET